MCNGEQETTAKYSESDSQRHDHQQTCMRGEMLLEAIEGVTTAQARLPPRGTISEVDLSGLLSVKAKEDLGRKWSEFQLNLICLLTCVVAGFDRTNPLTSVARQVPCLVGSIARHSQFVAIA